MKKSEMTTKNDINDTLNEILEVLKLIHAGQQVAPPIQPMWPLPVPQATNVCPKCGLNFEGMTGYVCTTFECPVFPQITC